MPELLKTLTDEQLANYERQALAIIAKDDTPEGLEAFYQVIFTNRMPVHVRKWAVKMYEAKEKGLGFSLRAFRGSTKTTFVQCVLCHQIGLNPTKASMVVQVSDDKADKFTKNVASIIEHNTGWKIVFPNIVPDKQRGWSSTGYEVMDSSMPYEKWRDLNAKRTTPSLIGCGWSSGMIVGSHPDLILILDDILDRNNTDSAKSMESVRETIKASINPAAEPGCFKMLAFTPWKEDDPVIEQSNSGNYLQVITPVYDVDPNGKFVWEKMQADKLLDTITYTPAWKKKGSPRYLQERYNDSGRIEFARMYLLDLSEAKNRVLVYHSYPNELIKSDWPMGGGVDYASAESNLNGNTKTDFFAMAYAAKIPGGGVVITDGVLERGTQATAELHVNKAQDMFPHWISSCVESNGKGDDFIQHCRRNPHLRMIPKNAGTLHKETRLQKTLSPWLESGQVRISDAETPFLNELRKELDEFPNSEHDDALDAVYYALFTVQDALKAINTVELPEANKTKKMNPYAGFGRK